MNRFATLLILGLSVTALAPSAARAQSARQHVTVTCSCDDSAGKAYVEALHRALAKSAQYREVGFADGQETDTIRINIVSLPLPDKDGRPQAALSIVCLHDGALMHQFVETCTRIPLEDCAQSMVTDLKNWTT